MTTKYATPATGELFRYPPDQLHRILVVDDDPYICQSNAEILRRHGYVADTATDGLAAWDSLQTNHYDLLVTDNDMPRMSGVQLLEKIHQAQLILPVIVASGTMPVEALEHPEWHNLEALLPKPYSAVGLLETVVNVLLQAYQEIGLPFVWQNQLPAGQMRL